MTAIGIAVGCATIRTAEREMNGLRRIAPRVVSHARAQNSSRVTENGLIDWTAICKDARSLESMRACRLRDHSASFEAGSHTVDDSLSDRKSTRLNSSHLGISYAVFCLKKKHT